MSVWHFFFISALAVAFLVFLFLSKKEKIQYKIAIPIFAFATLGGIYGAELWSIIKGSANTFNMKSFLLFQASHSWYGGLLSGILIVSVSSMILRVNNFQILDALYPGVTAGISLGRIGCFFAGCCPGEICESEVFKIFNYRHPFALYDSLINLGIFFFLFKRINSKNIKSQGEVFFSGLILYGISRFLLEYVRINPRVIFGFSAPQIVSCALIIYSTASLVIIRARKANLKMSLNY